MAPRKKAVEAEVEVMAVAEVQADVSPMAYSKQVGDIQGCPSRWPIPTFLHSIANQSIPVI